MTRRVPVVVILLGVILAALVYDRSDQEDAPVESTPVVPDGSVFPMAAGPDALSSTWFCAGGTADEEAFAAHTIHIANPTEQDVTVTVTAFPGVIAPPRDQVEGEDLDEPDPAGDSAEEDQTEEDQTEEDQTEEEPATVPDPVEREIEIDARSSATIGLSDLVVAPIASALVETGAGGVVVEHEVASVHGRDVKPCVTSAASTWHFAWGNTTVDARELLVLFNPFPEDVIVDGRFSTEDGVREPDRFQGLVVPARGSVAVDVGDDVTRRQEVAATITAREGRIVVDRILRIDGDGARGLTVQSGVPQPQTSWIYPDGYVSEEIREEYTVYNPGDQLAEVEIEFIVDNPEKNGIPERITLSLPPGSHQVVDIGADGRVPAEVGHTGIVRSANGVPVVAERVLFSQRETRRGISVTTGSPVTAEEWTFAAGAATSEVDEWLLLVNLDDQILTEVDVTAIIAGQAVPVSELQNLELGAGERRAIRIGTHISNRSELPLVITSTEPIVVERGMYHIGEEARGTSNAVGVPSARGVALPPDPFAADAEGIDLGDDIPDEEEDPGGEAPEDDSGGVPEAPEDVELPSPDRTIVIDDLEEPTTTTTTSGDDGSG